ncbi:50S ribosomal protein L22 [Candidatus Kuenenbacteria bacterium HGW-Kuenenbacteria-1]|uniref:Large ribosomal subunit protein uL22 n=1 Tax=Candidatus Kuenenbacteria bacterium HGW-Kuenenbacteria-1 TaxID=2013812 RepID=A0A2N1UNG7_9BACT|nr:MAG: 50S ribosomal protein L22 [Candidatus Kuenenbacteria bacterium HGW-Kuenenbacteria-1]
MEIKTKEKKKPIKIDAKAKYIRISSKKIRLVINVIRGMDVDKAEDQLKFITKRACQPILKLLNSAITNAEHNFDLKKKNLYIKEITVNQGPTLDRWMPRAFGRGAPIRKRTSHITIVLDKKNEEKINNFDQEIKEKEKEGKIIQVETVEDKKNSIKDTSLIKRPEAKKIKEKDKHSFAKKIFRRKTG